jgi:hypothetical protein
MEKNGATQTEATVVAGDSTPVMVETQGFDETATKRLLRKLDWNIIPFMSLIYL